MPSKRPPAKSAKTLPKLAEDRTPSEEIAHTILARYTDLSPSVERIMYSGLDEPGRLHAITLFRDSLGKDGDPNRDPANAIAAAQGQSTSS